MCNFYKGCIFDLYLFFSWHLPIKKLKTQEFIHNHITDCLHTESWMTANTKLQTTTPGQQPHILLLHCYIDNIFILGLPPWYKIISSIVFFLTFKISFLNYIVYSFTTPTFASPSTIDATSPPKPAANSRAVSTRIRMPSNANSPIFDDLWWNCHTSKLLSQDGVHQFIICCSGNQS